LVLPAPGGHVRNGDRRQRDRRAQPRAGDEDRRRRDRRRAAAGGLLLTGLSIAGALHGRGGSEQRSAATVASEEARPSPPLQTPGEEAVDADEPARAPGPFDAIIEEAAQTYGVDADLVRAVIRAESNFNPQAKSRSGAKGLMQLMPRLSRELGISNPFDPRENIFGGTQYLSKLLDRHDGNVSLALASFNAGPRNVARYRGIPPFKETRGYVKKITGLLADASTSMTDQGRGAGD
jgi:soluble lytic murein transglycosylase-like protein